MSASTVWVGIDAARAYAEVALPGTEARRRLPEDPA